MDQTETARQEAAYTPGRLPEQMTTTIGRDDEIAALVALLRGEEARLVTLTGPGGVGKTRVSLEVARALKRDFADGVFFISLAPMGERGQVLLAIAQAVGIDEAGGQSLERRLHEYLNTKHCLLLRNNFEHILPAASFVAELLAHAPRLTILASSREMLHIYGEREIVVPPLALPQLSEREVTVTGAAMTLFVERARAVKLAFALNDENRRAVAEICVQLDGLPLAIELAAARIKLLSPQAILARLSSRLNLLTGGARDLPTRQQTLRNTLDWSYDLLNEDEQRFFRRLGSFIGSWTFEAAEAIAGEEQLDPLYLLTSLVDKSLVRLVEETPSGARFLLLETIREYALECLTRHDEPGTTRHRHAIFYLSLAEAVEPDLQGAGQRAGLQCLDREAANIWAALHWAIERREVTTALRMASALREYLPLRSSLSDGRQWLEEVLAIEREYLDEVLALESTRETSILCARILYSAGILARMHSDLELAKTALMGSRGVRATGEDRHNY